MVGTKPTRSPSRFHSRTRARRRSISPVVSIMGRALVVGVFGPGETAVAHGLDVGARGAGNRAAPGEEVLHELRPPVAAVEAEHVVQHQHLAVAVRAGADAD